MKKFVAVFVIFLSFSLWGNKKSENNWSPGIKFMAGVRYDNLRMCVGSDPGVEGGPVADIMFLGIHRIDKKNSVVMNLPLFRPILFGMKFKMIQFEPEITWEIKKDISEILYFVSGPSLGASFHYGPDYKSGQSGDDRTDEFFAAGPLVSGFGGFGFKWPGNAETVVGLRVFHVSLFSEKSDYGMVLGGAADISMRF